ncbi:MAG: ferritin family protein [Rikenellaceae bacterium]
MSKTDKQSIRGTQTEKNLMKAFAGESQARNRYTFFAQVAHQEGYEKVATVFETVARNEKAHALVFFGFLEGGMVEMTGSYPAGVVGTTAENLAAAAAGEYDEWSDLYPEYAQVAKDEGFVSVALAFEYIVGIEREHESKFLALKKAIDEHKMFKSDEPTRWICSECGYEHNSKQAAGKCPVCGKGQGFFERKGCGCDMGDCECSEPKKD